MDTNTYIKGFRLTFENAKRLFNSAETLENEKEFPIANSLLILAAEEGIKAYTILTKYLFPEEIQDSFKMVFKDHTFKLQSLSLIVLLSKIIQKFYEYFYYPVLQNVDKSPEEIAKFRSKCIDNFVNWSKKESGSKKSNLSKQLDWWKHAKTMKETGFYVGYNNEKWIIPSSIKKEQYLKTKKYVDDFFQQLEIIFNLDFKDESTLELFTEIKQKMREMHM